MAEPQGPSFLLDPKVTFLNHGSFGACPAEVLDAQAELRARIEREPVVFLARELGRRLERAREILGDFVGARGEDLAFVANATTAVGTVLRSLELERGESILILDHAYNACRNAAEFAAAAAGAHVCVAELPFPVAGPDEVVEAVVSALEPGTRLALIDHVTSPTALVLPVQRLVGELESRGVPVLIDGAHAPGMLELDIERIGASYYTGNCHKWVCAPKGAAFLHVRPELQPSVRPLVISHGANAVLAPGQSRYRAEFDWMGTVDPTPFLSVPAALELMGGALPGGWDELQRNNRDLALEARALLAQALGLELPAPASMIASMATIELPPAGATRPSEGFWDALQDDLWHEERIEVPVFPWPEGRRLLRISAQLYNRPAEYERLARALAARLGA